MINCESKLKRGLKDLSPLFRTGIQGEQIPSNSRKATRIASVYDASTPCESAKVSDAFVKTLPAGDPCTIISINYSGKPGRFHAAGETGWNAPLISLSWEEFYGIIQRSVPFQPAPIVPSNLLLLSPDYARTHYFPDFFPILDYMIIAAEISEDSLKDAYKFIKGTKKLNMSLEYYLILRKRQGVNTAAIFERFAAMTANRIGVQTMMLGLLEEDEQGIYQCLVNQEMLLRGDLATHGSPGKIALAEVAGRMIQSPHKAKL